MKQVSALAEICGDAAHPQLRGTVRFFPCCGGTQIVAALRGLPNSETGFFGFHIHEGRSCGGAGFADTGSHFNPTDLPHPCHAGDLPPLLYCGGRARMCVVTDRFRVEDIIGRTVVIHSGPDDFHSQPAGNAGTKIACGVIRALG